MVSFRASGVARGLLASARNAPVVTEGEGGGGGGGGGVVLVNVPERFLPHLLNSSHIARLLQREPFRQSLVLLTSTLGSLSTRLRNPSAFPSPPNTTRSFSAPNFWRCSDWRK